MPAPALRPGDVGVRGTQASAETEWCDGVVRSCAQAPGPLPACTLSHMGAQLREPEVLEASDDQELLGSSASCIVTDSGVRASLVGCWQACCAWEACTGQDGRCHVTQHPLYPVVGRCSPCRQPGNITVCHGVVCGGPGCLVSLEQLVHFHTSVQAAE